MHTATLRKPHSYLRIQCRLYPLYSAILYADLKRIASPLICTNGITVNNLPIGKAASPTAFGGANIHGRRDAFRDRPDMIGVFHDSNIIVRTLTVESSKNSAY